MPRRAHPTPVPSWTPVTNVIQEPADEGMSLREHYVGLAMLGVMSNQRTSSMESPEHVAECAVIYADALLSKLGIT